MKTYFVSRHLGALQWAQQNNIDFDEHIEHLDVNKINPTDVVIGSLPVNLAYEVCRRGGCYFNLSLEIPQNLRGKELDTETLMKYSAKIEEFLITKKE